MYHTLINIDIWGLIQTFSINTIAWYWGRATDEGLFYTNSKRSSSPLSKLVWESRFNLLITSVVSIARLRIWIILCWKGHYTWQNIDLYSDVWMIHINYFLPFHSFKILIIKVQLQTTRCGIVTSAESIAGWYPDTVSPTCSSSCRIEDLITYVHKS